ncbi:MAG TPA: ABC transporter substrate-binding protein [Pseudonocardia sp.]|uniref:ABC transporter substrate-binding protein n=1 Tax=Pseudonocardia sp. TaxID=60912 RepID=UPI002B4B062E|nr:ABC transporter substrate-binding protein [Pseudonocardia sp.]HLU59255.1 ABC transporter substrate-binding protein [Pseudonocardia sp.]
MGARRTSWSALVSAVAAVALAVTACAGGGGDGAERQYVVAIDDDPRGLNAQLIAAPMTAMFSAQILEPLIFISTDYELSPALAESWELSEDGMDLRLALRQGVQWHDGTPFTAQDVKFNFEEIVPLSFYGQDISARLDSVEIVDDATVVLHMKEPYGPLLETVAAQFMVPRHLYEGTDYVTNEANMAPIGTGPMMFESYSSGEQIVLVKNPDYWGGPVQVDRAIFPIMGDAAARTEALFAGEIDQAVVDVAQLGRVRDNPDTMLLEKFAYPQYVAMMFNGENPYLADPAVRRAIFSAIDREAVADVVLQGFGRPATTFFPDSLGWANSPNIDFSRDFPRDVDAINKALDDAGFPRGPDGVRFTLDLRYTAERTETAAMAELARSMLADVGVGVNLVGTSAAVYTEKVYTDGDFGISFLPATVGPDPNIAMARWYMCNPEKRASANPSGICDPQIDAAALEAAGAASREQRATAFHAFQERAAELMIYAPVVWFNGQFPSVNTSRWAGQDEPQPASNRLPWLSMAPAV